VRISSGFTPFSTFGEGVFSNASASAMAMPSGQAICLLRFGAGKGMLIFERN
jgi:hypothetical protein